MKKPNERLQAIIKLDELLTELEDKVANFKINKQSEEGATADAE